MHRTSSFTPTDYRGATLTIEVDGYYADGSFWLLGPFRSCAAAKAAVDRRLGAEGFADADDRDYAHADLTDESTGWAA